MQQVELSRAQLEGGAYPIADFPERAESTSKHQECPVAVSPDKSMYGPTPPAEDSLARPTDSNLSGLTQAPTLIQRWAALMMQPEAENRTSGPSLQQLLSTITVAMQQAQREGLEFSQAQEVLAGLMSLASVQSPALPATVSGVKASHSPREDRKASLDPDIPENKSLPAPTKGSYPRTGDKRLQAPPSDVPPWKIAKTTQATVRGEQLSLEPSSGPSSQSWYHAPILIQQHSNPEPGQNANLPPRYQSAEPQRPGTTSRCRVYSNAFQEPLPTQRWGTNKSSRGKALEDTRTSAAVESRSRPQFIVTGASRQRDADVPERDTNYRRVASWIGTNSVQAGANTNPGPKPSFDPHLVVLPSNNSRPVLPEAHGLPQESAPVPQDPTGSTVKSKRRYGGTTLPAARADQPDPNALEQQMTAVWFARQKFQNHLMMMPEAAANPYLVSDPTTLANIEKKQAGQQVPAAAAAAASAQGGAHGGPALNPFLHLQQLAQSMGSGTNYGQPVSWPWGMSQSQPVLPVHPNEEQWKEAVAQHAAKTCQPGGSDRVYYQRSWPGDWDLQHSKRPAANWNRGGSLRTVNEKDNVEDCGPTIKQPVARRALPDSTRSLDRSIPQHLPGHLMDARAHLEQMVFPSSGEGRGPAAKPVVDLPTDKSWSTPRSRSEALRENLPRNPSTDSTTLTGPNVIDVNNPFEVVREYCAVANSPLTNCTKGFVHAAPVKQLTGAGNPLPHAPAFRPVTAPPIVVRQYKEAKSPSPQETECRNSSSTSSQEPASRNEDEEMAAQTLLSLFATPAHLKCAARGSPQRQDQRGPPLPADVPILRRPRSQRSRGKR